VTAFVLPSEDYLAVASRIERADGPISWSWMALQDDSGSWNVPLLAVRGASRCRRQVLRYRRLLLGCEQLTPVQAAQRFRKKIITRRSADGVPALKIDTPTYPERPLWITTEVDTVRYLAPPGEWPMYTINFNIQAQIGMPGLLEPLNASDQPYYPTIQAAISELLYALPPRHIGANIGPNVLVRLPDLRARLSNPASETGRLRIEVEEGRPGGAKGFRLKAAWRATSDEYRWQRQEIAVNRPRKLSIGIAGFPEEMWLILTDPTGVAVDRRGWSAEIGSPLKDLGPLASRVERWISEGEHGQLEFKQELGDRKVNESFAETVTAFANGTGGIVLIGVADDARVIGYDQLKVSDQVVDIIRSHVTDPPSVQADRVLIGRRPVWVVTVPNQHWSAKPFRCNGRVLVRANGTNRVATTAEHRQLAAEQPAYSFRPGFPSWLS
jgi:hypothetical protein